MASRTVSRPTVLAPARSRSPGCGVAAISSASVRVPVDPVAHNAISEDVMCLVDDKHAELCGRHVRLEHTRDRSVRREDHGARLFAVRELVRRRPVRRVVRVDHQDSTVAQRRRHLLTQPMNKSRGQRRVRRRRRRQTSIGKLFSQERSGTLRRCRRAGRASWRIAAASAGSAPARPRRSASRGSARSSVTMSRPVWLHPSR